ncbi:hypothetical protein, partial [Variovorax sp. WDL1]
QHLLALGMPLRSIEGGEFLSSDWNAQFDRDRYFSRIAVISSVDIKEAPAALASRDHSISFQPRRQGDADA